MKSATIKLVLNTEIKKILDSIKDPEVRQIASQNILVCGGAIASLLANEKVNDYDIYFKSFEAVEAVARYYCREFNETKGALATKAMHSCNPEVRIENRENIRGEMEKRVIIYIKSAGVAGEQQTEYRYFESESELSADEFMGSLAQSLNPVETGMDMKEDIPPANTPAAAKKGKFRPVFFTDNAITLSDKAQMVLRFWGDADEIHRNYDYAHAMCAYDYINNSLKLHPEALESILGRNLVYRGSLYPVASVFRIRKFLKRGWSITAGQMLKMIWQVNELDLKNPHVLREQLMGVDAAYMSQLISALAKREPGTVVDSTYIAKIIDEIFD
jgi:hypothetical protein